MTPTLSAVLAGLIAVAVALIGAVASVRAARSTAKAQMAAGAWEGYDELVANLRAEVERLHKEIDIIRDRSREDIKDCEERSRRARDEIVALLSQVATLRAIVNDEIARVAAGEVLDLYGAQATDEDTEREVDNIRHFLEGLPPEHRP